MGKHCRDCVFAIRDLWKQPCKKCFASRKVVWSHPEFVRKTGGKANERPHRPD
jgi:hypothetical protein